MFKVMKLENRSNITIKTEIVLQFEFSEHLKLFNTIKVCDKKVYRTKVIFVEGNFIFTRKEL